VASVDPVFLAERSAEIGSDGSGRSARAVVRGAADASAGGFVTIATVTSGIIGPGADGFGCDASGASGVPARGDGATVEIRLGALDSDQVVSRARIRAAEATTAPAPSVPTITVTHRLKRARRCSCAGVGAGVGSSIVPSSVPSGGRSDGPPAYDPSSPCRKNISSSFSTCGVIGSTTLSQDPCGSVASGR
jgi:hypothetical protein